MDSGRYLGPPPKHFKQVVNCLSGAHQHLIIWAFPVSPELWHQMHIINLSRNLEPRKRSFQNEFIKTSVIQSDFSAWTSLDSRKPPLSSSKTSLKGLMDSKLALPWNKLILTAQINLIIGAQLEDNSVGDGKQIAGWLHPFLSNRHSESIQYTGCPRHNAGFKMSHFSLSPLRPCVSWLGNICIVRSS